MANALRGEIDVVLDGRPYTACLTLGALAELESAFGSETLIGVIERFQSGQVKAGDMITVITAGLRAGGHDVSASDVAAMQVEGGVEGYVDIVAQLLKATFGFSDVL